MTNRWVNVVLAVVVTLGLVAVAVHERPQAARERAELLGQEVVDAGVEAPGEGAAPVVGAGALLQAPGSAAAGGGQPERPYGVSAGHPAAVDVGMQVLEAGGSAVDAAVAVSYTLAVVEPFGSGIGGGGAMVVHPLEGTPVAYDYREVAPASGELPASDIGVPGFVAGMAHVHAEHGDLDFETLVEPAIAYAAEGAEVSTILAQRLRAAAHRLPVHQLPWFFPDGAAIEPGEILVQPEHAEALRAIRDGGPEAFYAGPLTAEVAGATGLDPADFEAYEVAEIPVASGSFAGYDVVAAGPPVSGPTLVQHLQILEAGGIADLEPGSAPWHHLLAQAYRIAVADRSEYVADPGASDVPLDELLAPAYAEEWASAIPPEGHAEVSDERVIAPAETDTTHLVVVDRDGTMVSATNTLSNFFGSGLAVSGFFLNDQMRNFSRDPESVNAVAPGKRPRSFVTPAIVARDGVPLLGIGSPGGRRIPAMVAQVVLRWAAHGQPIEEAAAAPRVHVEGRDLEFEAAPGGETAAGLQARGYAIVTDVPFQEYFGAVQVLLADPDTGELTGVADDRRGGTWQAAGS